ncbi:unnamed protein product [Paramecium sonneborni]|uniref:Uncharacterized protein n=1 Tax=Paramecium sonneborni TaxID=65129 RepID=A0A8S1Q2Y7_9CILI|nr:unnamed protein product [Paramecium sonneborni]
MSIVQASFNDLSTTNFSYDVLSTISQEIYLCFAIAINKNKTQLIAGDNDQIKIFQLKNGNTKLLKIIYNFDNITTLNYFRFKQNFISGSENGCLTIWSSSSFQSSKYLVKLTQCSNTINCLVLHQNEDLIISSSNSINFWYSSKNIIQHQQWINFQTIFHGNVVFYGLSLNKNGNKLITCVNDNFILLMVGSNVEQWKITQRISVENQGARLTFISDKIFVFQPYQSNYLQIFSNNLSSEQYIKTLDIPVKGGNEYCYEYFPSFWIPSKNIIISKNARYINIIQIYTLKENTSELKFNLKQNIQFGTKSIFGTVSEDGEYIIIWDYETNQIQIRKYNLII